MSISGQTCQLSNSCIGIHGYGSESVNTEDKESCQDIDNLLLSLPRTKGWRAPHLYQYQGYWHEPTILEGVLACQQQFEAQDTDILLVTAPKSGTTWLKALIFTLVNRKLYPLTQLEHPLLTKNPHDLVPFLELNLYAHKKIPDFSSFTSPRILSSHFPLTSLPKSVHDSKCKLVYLCRNPKDNFTSLWHFLNRSVKLVGNIEPASLEEAFDMFCRGVNIYGPFWNHVLDYWKESCQQPDRILFLKYEEMKEQPVLQLKCLAEFLEFPFSAEEEASGVAEEILRLCSFDNLSNLEVNKTGKLSNSGQESNIFFRRGEIGDWKNLLSAEMADKLDSVTEQKFQGSGLRL